MCPVEVLHPDPQIAINLLLVTDTDLIGVGVLQIGIDARDNTAEASRHRAEFGRLWDPISVEIGPDAALTTEVVGVDRFRQARPFYQVEAAETPSQHAPAFAEEIDGRPKTRREVVPRDQIRCPLK